jgi:hypothetical protein
LYKQYEDYCGKKKNGPAAEIAVSFYSKQSLGSLIYREEDGNVDGLKLIEKYKKSVMWLRASKTDMLNFFRAKNWIGEDDIPEPKSAKMSAFDLEDKYDDAKDRIETLEKENAALKKLLADLGKGGNLTDLN